MSEKKKIPRFKNWFLCPLCGQEWENIWVKTKDVCPGCFDKDKDYASQESESYKSVDLNSLSEEALDEVLLNSFC